MSVTSGMQCDENATAPPPEWLGRLAHDVRGPIGPIQMAARMLEGNALTADQVPELGKAIERQANRLQRIADELDEVYRIGMGAFDMHVERCDLCALAKGAIDEATAFATSVGKECREVSWRQSAEKVEVMADPVRLPRLIAQLLLAVSPSAGGDAACWIVCERRGNEAVVRVRDGARRIYRSTGIDYLTKGQLPEDPGVLAMASVIGRQIALGHGATIDGVDESDGRIGTLELRMALAPV